MTENSKSYFVRSPSFFLLKNTWESKTVLIQYSLTSCNMYRLSILQYFKFSKSISWITFVKSNLVERNTKKTHYWNENIVPFGVCPRLVLYMLCREAITSLKVRLTEAHRPPWIQTHGTVPDNNFLFDFFKAKNIIKLLLSLNNNNFLTFNIFYKMWTLRFIFDDKSYRNR